MSNGTVHILFKSLLISIFLVTYCNYAESIYYKIKNIECKPNRNYFQNISCNLKPINWTRSIVNMECDIIGKVSNVTLAVETFYRDYRNLYKPFLIKFKYNLCQLFDQSKPKTFFEMYTLHHFKTLTNINHSCPYTGHLFAHKFHLDEVSLPPLPLQDYKICFNFTRDKPALHFGTVILYFEAREEYRKHRFISFLP